MTYILKVKDIMLNLILTPSVGFQVKQEHRKIQEEKFKAQQQKKLQRQV